MSDKCPRWEKIVTALAICVFCIVGAFAPHNPSSEGPYLATMVIRFHNDFPCLAKVDISSAPSRFSYEAIPLEGLDIPALSNGTTWSKFTTGDDLLLEFTFENGTAWWYSIEIGWQVPEASAVDIYNGFWTFTISELRE